MTNISNPKPHLFTRMDAHHRLFVSLAVGGIVLALAYPFYSAIITAMIAWMAFATSTIILIWISIFTSHPIEVRKIAKIQDSSRVMIFAFVIVASVVSLLAIYFLLKSAKGHGANVSQHVLLAITSVFISWWLVHTIFTVRYAHMYYDTDRDDGTQRKARAGGLNFPEDHEPDYLDFVYFSFVIGMTFQVSDVEISSRPIRRLALLHALISFIFNTAIVALSINIISGLVSA